MKYIFKESSLEQIAGVKIVSELMKQEEIKYRISLFDFLELCPGRATFGYWKTFEEKLKTTLRETAWALPLPKHLKNNLISLTGPLSSEVRSWWFYHKNLVLKKPNEFCWTPQGTIDNKKTAELMVQDENVDIETRYKMACTYCFENEISILWQRIPEASKEMFYNFESRYEFQDYEPRDMRNGLVVFWTYSINDKLTELHECIQETYGFDLSAYEFAFRCATFGLNRTACGYFFEKLTSEEKNENLISCLHLVLSKGFLYSCKMETVLFVLSQMSEGQREIVFQWGFLDLRCKYLWFDAFLCMLDWPYQSFLLKMAKKYFQYLLIIEYQYPYKKCRYFWVLDAVWNEIKRDKNNYKYKELFQKFWQLASVKDSNFFQNDYILLNLIELYEAKEVELVKYMLNRATNLQKQQLIYIKGREHCNLLLLIDKEKWNFLQFLMAECITCKEIIINFESYVTSQHSNESDAESKAKLIMAKELVVNLILKWK